MMKVNLDLNESRNSNLGILFKKLKGKLEVTVKENVEQFVIKSTKCLSKNIGIF